MKLEVLLIILPCVVMFLYAIVGSIYVSRGEYGWALVWLCYAGANLGMILAARGV